MALLPPQLLALLELLAVPPEADATRLSRLLEAETQKIIEERSAEVAEWRSKLDGLRTDCDRLAAALGVKSSAELWMGEPSEILPKRYAMLESHQKNSLLSMYETRMAEVKALMSQLDTLSLILPASFPLYPRATTVSSLMPSIGLGRPGDAAVPSSSTAAVDKGPWEDASEARIAELKSCVQRGQDERVRLLVHLKSLLITLLDLLPEVEIDIPLPYPLPTLASIEISSSSSVLSPTPASSVPPQSEQEKAFYIILENFAQWETTCLTDTLTTPGGLEGVEPTVALVNWVRRTIDEIKRIKESREQAIQDIYDALEPLWCTLNTQAEDIDAFMEANRGSSEASVANYRAELKRMLALKLEYMETFVLEVRERIKTVQDELLLGEEEREAFSPFWDYNYTEQLLELHNEELARLTDEADSKRQLMSSVLQWRAICAEEQELLEASRDPSRLTGRGRPGQMLREEKIRNRVEKLKPKLERDLLDHLPIWEERYGRPFLVHGERIIDVIEDAILAKEAEKEQRKRARQGGAATPAVSVRSHTPARAAATPRVTPGSSFRAHVKQPLATPSAATSKPNKLARGMTPSSSLRASTASSSSSGMQVPLTACRLPQPARSVGGGSMYMTPRARLVSGASSVASSSAYSNVFGGGGAASSRATSVSGRSGAGSVAGGGRRESFKPRKSQLPPPEHFQRPSWSSPIAEDR